MSALSPVWTRENECQDCYKCVRHCPVKAIRVTGGKAAVIPEACVACGACVKVCPARAKQIRNDIPRLRSLLASGARLYASVAPSFAGYFKGVSIERLAGALKKLGFEGVSETAHGAEAVSAEVARILRETDNRVVISSACPAAVNLIRKYKSEWTEYISKAPSPVRAHCRLLKKRYGADVKVVFFGPCAAKKSEADEHPDELELAVVFPKLEDLFAEKKIDPATEAESELALGPAAEGRFYSVEGGMNDTLRDGADDVRYISVSSLGALRRILNVPVPQKSRRKIFIEALACGGGCVNGPAMPEEGSRLSAILETDNASGLCASAARGIETSGGDEYRAEPVEPEEYPENLVKAALARTGKTAKSDELNCGACGYRTCREFAKALIEGKAEEAMCHTFLKQNFARKSNALIKYIPAALVIVDENLKVVECNRNFAQLADAAEVFDAVGGLDGAELQTLVPEIADLMKGAILHGSEVEQYSRSIRNRIANVSVFPIATGQAAGAVIQDVTQNEFHRQEIAQKAREVIRRNVRTVQEVARLFGEHIAQSEIMLNEIAGVYKSETRGVSMMGATDEEAYLNG